MDLLIGLTAGLLVAYTAWRMERMNSKHYKRMFKNSDKDREFWHNYSKQLEKQLKNK